MSPSSAAGGKPLLAVEGLETQFRSPSGIVRAVDRVSFDISEGEILTVIGESGSGKSVTALSIMRLISQPGRIVGGSVRLNGRNLLDLSERQMRAERGRAIGMIFQNPYTALHPFFRIGAQMQETLTIRGGLDKAMARHRAIALLERIRVDDPEATLERFPHEVSAGTCQRVMLALALATNPRLLIADEPTTNLDAVAQLEILQLLQELRGEFGLAILLITHDFAVVSRMADRVLVMYAGRAVESGTAARVLGDPAHPYSRGLIASARALSENRARLEQIPGEVPDLTKLPEGCGFRPRCPLATGQCRMEPPERAHPGGGMARCWNAEALAESPNFG